MRLCLNDFPEKYKHWDVARTAALPVTIGGWPKLHRYRVERSRGARVMPAASRG